MKQLRINLIHRSVPKTVGILPRNLSTLLRVSAVVILLLSLTSQPASAQLLGSRSRADRPHHPTRLEQKVQQEITDFIRPGDEVWIINTRAAQNTGCALECLDASTTVYQKVGQQYLPNVASHLIDRINQDTIRENVVFIHGNRTDFRWARLRGTQTYEAILDVNRCQDSLAFSGSLPPVRWIIWSWPSDKIKGPARDLAIKRQRAFKEGRLLAMFLQQVQQKEIGVLAYSLGAQALVSALCCWESVGQVCSDPTQIQSGDLNLGSDAEPFAIDNAESLAELEITPADLTLEFETADLESETVIDVQESQSVMQNTQVVGFQHDNIAATAPVELTLDTVEEMESVLNRVTESTDDLAGDLAPDLAAESVELSPLAIPLVDCEDCNGPKLRIVMVAAAVPVDWFHSQLGRNCMKRCTASLTLINNPRDRVLEVYRKLTHLGPLGTQASYSESLFPTIVHLVRNNALNNHVLTEYFAGESTREQIRGALFPCQ